MEAERNEKGRQIPELRIRKLLMVELMDKSLDIYKQNSKKNYLLIHGVKENEKENTELL